MEKHYSIKQRYLLKEGVYLYGSLPHCFNSKISDYALELNPRALLVCKILEVDISDLKIIIKYFVNGEMFVKERQIPAWFRPATIKQILQYKREHERNT